MGAVNVVWNMEFGIWNLKYYERRLRSGRSNFVKLEFMVSL